MLVFAAAIPGAPCIHVLIRDCDRGHREDDQIYGACDRGSMMSQKETDTEAGSYQSKSFGWSLAAAPSRRSTWPGGDPPAGAVSEIDSSFMLGPAATPPLGENRTCTRSWQPTHPAFVPSVRSGTSTLLASMARQARSNGKSLELRVTPDRHFISRAPTRAQEEPEDRIFLLRSTCTRKRKGTTEVNAMFVNQVKSKKMTPQETAAIAKSPIGRLGTRRSA